MLMEEGNVMRIFIFILRTIAHWLRLTGRNKNKALKAYSTCCSNKEWTGVADFDRAAGFDFYLGRCANCSSYLLQVSYADWPTEHVIGKREAEKLLRLKGTPMLRKALRRWVGE